MEEVKAEKQSDKSYELFLTLFLAGFLIYIVVWLISQSNKVNYVMVNVVQLFGMFAFIPAGIFLIRSRITSTYLKILYVLLWIWALGIIVRGISFEYDAVKELLFSPTAGIFLYLVPVILLFHKKPVVYKRIFDVILIMGIIYLILCLVFIKALFVTYNEERSQALIEYFTQHLGLPMGFMLLTYVYHSGKRRWFAVIIVVITFLLAVIRARRGLIFITFSAMSLSYLVYQYVNKARLLNIVFSVFVIAILAAGSAMIYQANRKSTFSLITERINQHTRSRVEQYYYEDLKLKDWIFGKGINGKYFCPGVIEGAGRISIYRKVIETGYLQIILNGGIINLVLIVLIVVPAIFKGLGNSKNLLSKAAAIWLILFILYSYPGTPVVFSFNYILVWFSIGICYSDEVRNIEEVEMKKLLSNSQKVEREEGSDDQ